MWKAILSFVSWGITLFWGAERIIGLAGFKDDFTAILRWLEMIPDFWGGAATASAIFFTVWWLWPGVFAKKAEAPPTKVDVVQPDVNPSLQKELEREAEAKVRSDQVDAEFRTLKYNLNTALGALLGASPRKDEDDK